MYIHKNLLLTGLVLAGLAFSAQSVFAQADNVNSDGLNPAADTSAPSDIERAPTVVSVGNGSVTLQWDVAMDNVAVTGYKVYYGTKSLPEQKNNNSKGEYDSFIKVDNTNQTTISGLSNGTKYYFAVTALDAAGNEGEYYSPEASATPSASNTANTNAGGTTNSNSSNGNINSGTANTNASATGNTNSIGAVTNSNGNVQAVQTDNTITVTWSAGTVSDMVDQILYTSKDGGTSFDQGVHLGKALTSYTLTTFEANTPYAFKVVLVNGNNQETTLGTANLTTSADSTLPSGKDVMNLVAKFERVLSKYTVTLEWELPAEMTDIIAQIVYQSLDGNVFTQLASLGPTIRTYQIRDLAAGKYFFKVTTKDSAGKESAGVVKMVELPASGPAVAALALISLLGAGIWQKKKNKNSQI